LAATVLGVFYATHDREKKSALAMDYYAYRQMWPEAIAAVQGRPLDPYTACAATQAAYHAGLLSGQVPPVQNPEDLLLLGRTQIAHWKQGELYLDLGYVNEAMHHFTEAVEAWGERPGLLERLVVLNLAMGNIDTARIYLNALERVPFHSRWARSYLQRMESDPSLTEDPDVARLRSMTVQQDTVAHPGAESQLLMLMAANSGNRMAFEYLMTYYLLTKNLEGFARRLPHMKDFPSLKLSPLWVEPMVLWAKRQGQSPGAQAPPGWAECQERLDHILHVIKACGQNQEAARAQLQSDYGNSYFFYYFFHR
jgi:tetratricopeptide (TPR) repeat protein